jgi:hypothetical protein
VDDSGGPDLDALDLEALTDLCTPWCVHVAVTLRIAEHIAAGASDLTSLAAATGCDAYALHAMLGHLVSKGVFEQPSPGRFTVNRAARELSANRFLDLRGIGGRMAGAWSTLIAYVQTGRPAYSEVFGLPFWEDLEAHPAIAADFDELMGIAGHGAPDPDFPLADGWDEVRTVVDVGGGTGAMLASILRFRPSVRGTLVDLPGAVARSASVFEGAGVADRVTYAGQSFFDPLPAGADLYLLRKVLNDWPDAETVAILRRCAEAARGGPGSGATRGGPGGRVAVLGGVAPDDSPPRLAIDMVVAGGRTNSITEFRSLAEQAGLEVTAAARQPSGGYLVECHPLTEP